MMIDKKKFIQNDFGTISNNPINICRMLSMKFQLNIESAMTPVEEGTHHVSRTRVVDEFCTGQIPDKMPVIPNAFCVYACACASACDACVREPFTQGKSVSIYGVAVVSIKSNLNVNQAVIFWLYLHTNGQNKSLAAP